MHTNQSTYLEQAEPTLRGHRPLVACGQTVVRGERVAQAARPGQGDIHAPIAGTVTHVDAYRIRIRAEGEGEVDPVDLSALSGQTLYDAILQLGADLPPLDTVHTLIINGVDAEPGIRTREQLLVSSRETLERGLDLTQALYTPCLTTLAVLKGSPHSLGVHTTSIDDTYPAGLDPLVAKTATGKENPDGVLVIGLEALFHAGRIMETGLPIMETPVTAGGEVRFVPLGMGVWQILAEAGAPPQERDRIVLGGPLRGEAAALPTQGVDRTATAVTLVRNPEPVAVDTACIGCGECVRRCPARLDPAMLTSYAEFGLLEKAAGESIEACFECGLCGYHCVAHRPMLQYIRLAKSELARIREEAAS